jgi:hypothetical protein
MFMPPLEIPANYEDITPEWLTQALRDNGTLQDAALTSINAAPLGEQRGFTGIIVRFELECDRDEDGAPATLVGKFPSLNRFDNPDPEAIEFIGRIYQGEIRFYREIAPHAPIRTPHF